jgi:hypothetical protein
MNGDEAAVSLPMEAAHPTCRSHGGAPLLELAVSSLEQDGRNMSIGKNIAPESSCRVTCWSQAVI